MFRTDVKILLHLAVISLCIVLTLPQMGHADGSFLYFVPSSPFASISSLFMFFEPNSTEHTYTKYNIKKKNNLITPVLLHQCVYSIFMASHP